MGCPPIGASPLVCNGAKDDASLGSLSSTGAVTLFGDTKAEADVSLRRLFFGIGSSVSLSSEVTSGGRGRLGRLEGDVGALVVVLNLAGVAIE